MKRSGFILLLLLLVSFSCHAFFPFHAVKDSSNKSHFLDLKGRIMVGKKSLAGTLVTIYADTGMTVVQKVEADGKGYVAFHLPVQREYTMKISKQGYVTKRVSIDTRMPRDYEIGDYFFEFSVDLFLEIEGVDVSILKFPVAKIFFNTFNKGFDYDFNYTAKINKDLKKMYEEYDKQKKELKEK